MSARVLKCVVWDLDDTLWTGVFGEGDPVVLRTDAAALVRELDRRGVLQSIASRSNEEALNALNGMGLREYFLYPELGSIAKSAAVTRIANRLEVSLDAVVFLDDDPVERAEVAMAAPDVLCVDAADVATFVDRPDVLIPRGTGLNRRKLHLADLDRSKAETLAGGPSEAFLHTLGMSMVLRRAEAGDFARIEELMLRTNQLATTGRYLPVEELESLAVSDAQLALVADLSDRFGDYGTIGFALVRCGEVWTLRTLNVSCRVRDRGVGGVILDSLMRGAERAGAPLRADFVHTERNRRMYVTLKLAGFEEVERISTSPPAVVLQAEGAKQPRPRVSPWIAVEDATGELGPVPILGARPDESR
jgi:FkbH-like protein